jgi:hypothetical protein
MRTPQRYWLGEILAGGEAAGQGILFLERCFIFIAETIFRFSAEISGQSGPHGGV